MNNIVIFRYDGGGNEIGEVTRLFDQHIIPSKGDWVVARNQGKEYKGIVTSVHWEVFSSPMETTTVTVYFGAQ